MEVDKNTREIDDEIRKICGNPSKERFASANENCRSEHFPEVQRLLKLKVNQSEYRLVRFWKTVPPDLRGHLIQISEPRNSSETSNGHLSEILTRGSPGYNELKTYLKENGIYKKYPHFKLSHIAADYQKYYSTYAQFSTAQYACMKSLGERSLAKCPNPKVPNNVGEIPYLPYVIGKGKTAGKSTKKKAPIKG